MYHVEVIPNTSSSTATPGWTYVPDKGFDPAKAAIAPSLGRKRGIRDPARTDISSRQANAIVRHLAELDRENQRDVTIPVPVRQRDPNRPDMSRGTRTKTTSNVRRILQSQKTFRNYLDDEEAALAQAASTGASGGIQRVASNRVAKPASSRQSSTPTTTPRADQARAKKDSLSTRKPPDNVPSETENETQPQPQPQPIQEAEQQESALIPSKYDNDPLLKSYIPPAPSERIMRALLAEPPLTYNASRAGPPLTGRSARRFCCICGYWGKIRCRGCHQRTCGMMECYKTHQDSRCGAFF
ncbi:hypothetical protein BJX61DRAFT_254979 [Aspergillus egyptiacus]|nr:hypothetical protein BJX61DRAFT_254979 [Aspergillus egyptiacus]